MTDWSLLRQYLDTGSQAAFSKLMDRRMKLVYWTCRRDLRDDRLAEDATQAVFVLLVQKAPNFNKGVSISSWLFQAARFISRDLVRREAIRKRYEEEAAQMMEYRDEAERQWPRVELKLNEAIATLRPDDQEAVLLRYFEGLSLSEVAGEIGTTEDTARKRVARAVERMRRYLTGKEVAVSAAALAALLAAHPAKAVPSGARAAAHAAIGQMMAGHAPAHLSSFFLNKGASLIMQTTKAKIVAAIAVVAVGLLMVGGIANWKAYRAYAAAFQPGFTDLTAATAPANDPTLPDRRAIAACLAKFTDRWNDRDISGLQAMLAQDVVVMGRNGQPDRASGSAREELIAARSQLAGLPYDKMHISLISETIQGDSATTRIQVTEMYKETLGGPIATHTDAMVIDWTRRDGKWLATRMQNSS